MATKTAKTAEEPAVETPPAEGSPLTVTVYEPALPVPISREDVLTEQEKSTTPDPVGEPVEPGPKVEGPGVRIKEPYPEGNPPDPEDAFYQAHGYRREKPAASSVGPSGE